MKKLYKKISLTCLSILLITSVSGQNQNLNFWSKSSKSAVANVEKVNRNSQPQTSQIYSLDFNALKNALIGAPVRWQSTAKSNLIIAFPTAEGEMENYRVMESSIMEPSLQASLPNIRTYVAQGIDDPTAYMRFSVTQFGLHTMSLSGKRSTLYIDPYTKDRNTYIIYDRSSLGSDPQPFVCLTPEDNNLPSMRKDKIEHNKATDDQKFRTFRLAQTCTAEYGNIFATTPGNEFNDIMAQMIITINRVNSVYEVDLGITLEFIANEAALVFWGSTSADPWNGEYNTTTQNFLNSTLANGDYDIGHNFNTSGGGNAGCIACVCTNGQKGSGMTGRANPTGDPFDIDYVAHEMGHQFGGYHTMNTCSRSGSGQTEVEPASGSSVMGYAGICSSNVQSNSDAHFNYVNVRDISINVQPGGNSTCASEVTITNSPPTADAGPDFTIPKSTAFILEGTGTDPDGNASLTYEWSENDPAQSPGNASPLSTYTVGPMYRAKMPITSPNRYMPRLQDVRSGNLTPTWEVTPSVGRILNFSFMVRDNDIQGGQTADDLMKVTVDGGSGPFEVTSQTSNVTWDEGTTKTITWNVANSTAAPVSCANVDIFLSIDAGMTFPFTLATGVPNNGSANIIVPSGATTNVARIMVRGSGNIFYALNSSYFTITSSEFVMSFAPGAAANDVCAPNDATFNFTYNTYLGFNQVTTFSASGNPAGTNVTFNPTTAQNDGTPVAMTISGITPAMVGSYTVTVTGTAPSPVVVKNADVTLDVFDATFSAISLTSPANGATSVMGPYVFDWVADPNAATYDIDIATDAAFTNIVDNATGLATNSYTSSILSSGTTYYWRVKPANQCGNGSFSTAYSFTTSNCSSIASTDLGQVSNVPSFTSTINVALTGNITDVNLSNLVIPITWVGDLSATLTSPLGTIVQLFDGPGIPASTYGCSGDDIDASFDDGAALTSTDFENMCNNSPAISGTFQPIDPLSVFNGESVTGNWILTVFDSYTSGDDGTLNGWGLDFCLTSPVSTDINDKNNSIKIYPNPTNGLFTIDLNTIEGSNKFTITSIDGRIIKQINNVNKTPFTIDLNNESKGIYILKVQHNNEFNTYKIVKQ